MGFAGRVVKLVGEVWGWGPKAVGATKGASCWAKVGKGAGKGWGLPEGKNHKGATQEGCGNNKKGWGRLGRQVGAGKAGQAASTSTQAAGRWGQYKQEGYGLGLGKATGWGR